MKKSKVQRGAKRITPNKATTTRQAMFKVNNMTKNMVKNALEIIPKSISQSTLVVKQGFLSALQTMRNADLLVKLSESFSKREKQ